LGIVLDTELGVSVAFIGSIAREWSHDYSMGQRDVSELERSKKLVRQRGHIVRVLDISS
jgi:hypothetical protein